jgi:hypothetical protein
MVDDGREEPAVATTLFKYRQYAKTCRRLAYAARPEEERAALRQMAEAWEALAEERSRLTDQAVTKNRR